LVFFYGGGRKAEEELFQYNWKLKVKGLEHCGEYKQTSPMNH